MPEIVLMQIRMLHEHLGMYLKLGFQLRNIPWLSNEMTPLLEQSNAFYRSVHAFYVNAVEQEEPELASLRDQLSILETCNADLMRYLKKCLDHLLSDLQEGALTDTLSQVVCAFSVTPIDKPTLEDATQRFVQAFAAAERAASQQAKEGAWRDAAAYAALLKPHAITSLLAVIKQREFEQKERLTQHFGRGGATSAIRLQRIIDVYQQWQRYLQSHPVVNDAYSTRYLLTYYKKAYCHRAFKQQEISQIQQHLMTRIQLQQNTSLPLLRKEKDALKKTITLQQAALQSRFTYPQIAYAIGLLAIRQQGPYQLGLLTSEFISHELESYPVPFLQEKLPPVLQARLNEAVGLTFLGLTFWTSGWIGYSYQTAFSLRQMLFAEQDIVTEVGGYFDAGLQPVERLILQLADNTVGASRAHLLWLGEALRFDEQGLVDKEEALLWITGLLIHLGLQGGEPFYPLLIAYMIATACAKVVEEGAGHVADYFDFGREAKNLLKAFAHMLGYVLTYPYTFRVTAKAFVPPAEDMPQREALKLFGFHQPVPEKELKARYHQMALEKHPDKCFTPVCNTEMQAINIAYRVLKNAK